MQPLISLKADETAAVDQDAAASVLTKTKVLKLASCVCGNRPYKTLDN